MATLALLAIGAAFRLGVIVERVQRARNDAWLEKN
jgi:hypothetical protein